jgi:hypothetical protein
MMVVSSFVGSCPIVGWAATTAKVKEATGMTPRTKLSMESIINGARYFFEMRLVLRRL